MKFCWNFVEILMKIFSKLDEKLLFFCYTFLEDFRTDFMNIVIL